MSWYKKVKYDCRHTTLRIEKQQNGRLGMMDMIALYTHLLTCPFCRLYKKQTRILQQIFQEVFTAGNAVIMDETFKEQLQRMIDERL
ncbi:hypothetical protein A9P82_10580 [Arachidicoccus ginsenosidimutans]|uniref:hypothetical protein n=1 Tax=Arachidicoccus sp. BS20 TaxID=1850526 RepID=UPI0007F079EF|nr:hypothetical protein [Arachidicoccus sp. BS20]ANI89695.1 hypothetical protein A9P82_10580 [Arachidicoccus sp. BS20]